MVTSKNINEAADTLFKKYRPQMEALACSPLAGVRSITENDIYALGAQLDNYKSWESFMNENAGGTAAELGQLPKVALDIITAAYGSSIVPVVASVQPIEEEQGIIYYKSLVTKSTRGNMNANEQIFDATHMPQKFPEGYAAAVKSEEVNKGTGGDLTDSGVFKVSTVTYTWTLDVDASTGDVVPLRPNTVWFYVEHGTISGTTGFTVDAISQLCFGKDDGQGNILGKGMSGSVNYATGQVTVIITDATIVAAINNVGATGDTAANFKPGMRFEQNFEEAGNNAIGKIQYELQTKNIQAQVFALTEQIGLLKSYSLQKRFKKSAEDEMMNDLVNSLTMEIGGAVLSKVANGARSFKPAGAGADYKNEVIYNMKSYQAPVLAVQTLGLRINEAAQKIYEQSGRGEGNIIVASPTACFHLQSQADFKPSNVSIQGPHVFGTLNGMTVIRTPQRVNGYSDQNTCFVIYKGTGNYDSSVVYAPYMPLFTSGSIPILNNPMAKQGLVATWAGLDCVCPQFATEIKFSNTYNPEEQFAPYTEPNP